MKRWSKTWCLFVLGAAVVLGVMAYISWLTLKSEAKTERSHLVAAHRARERTALWRLDSALSPLITNETGRAIVSLIDANAPYGEIPPFFKLFFALDAGQVFGYGPSRELSAADRAIIAQFDLNSIKGELSHDFTWNDPRAQSFNRNIADLNGAAQMTGNFENNDQHIRAQRRNLTNAMNPMSNALSMSLGAEALTPYSGHWSHDRAGHPELFLARPTGKADSYQFVWVAWSKLSPWLLEQIQLEIPDADLQPVTGPQGRSNSALLTELPLKLTSDPLATTTGPDKSVIAILMAGWGAVVLALISIAVVLHLSLRLGDRRARFVSTVTHELRTPMTTFRMYSQMLADGMIPTEEKRQSYLQTLKEESERVSRVLESVLLYSRLEEGRAAARKSEIAVADLLDHLLVPMARQAKVYDLVFHVNCPSAEGVVVNTDVQVVEQIMLNLLDNVAKYASALSTTVEFESAITGGDLRIDLADHGPGVPVADQKKIFKEFHRGKGSHREGFSGLGLGLALGRDLARGLGGDLTLVEPGGPGARFRLTLPLHSS